MAPQFAETFECVNCSINSSSSLSDSMSKRLIAFCSRSSRLFILIPFLSPVRVFSSFYIKAFTQLDVFAQVWFNVFELLKARMRRRWCQREGVAGVREGESPAWFHVEVAPEALSFLLCTLNFKTFVLIYQSSLCTNHPRNFLWCILLIHPNYRTPVVV